MCFILEMLRCLTRTQPHSMASCCRVPYSRITLHIRSSVLLHAEMSPPTHSANSCHLLMVSTFWLTCKCTVLLTFAKQTHRFFYWTRGFACVPGIPRDNVLDVLYFVAHDMGVYSFHLDSVLTDWDSLQAEVSPSRPTDGCSLRLIVFTTSWQPVSSCCTCLPQQEHFLQQHHIASHLQRLRAHQPRVLVSHQTLSSHWFDAVVSTLAFAW